MLRLVTLGRDDGTFDKQNAVGEELPDCSEDLLDFEDKVMNCQRLELFTSCN